MRTPNTIRFSGLSSGLDTEAMVSAMTAPHKMKADSAWKQQKIMELKQEKWETLNKRIYSFYSDIVSNMSMQGNFMTPKTTVSHPGILNLDKNIFIPEGSHEIKVDKLATEAMFETEKMTKTDGTKVDRKTTLEQLGISGADLGEGVPAGNPNGIGKLSISGAAMVVTKDTTIADIEKELSKGAHADVKFDEKNGMFIIKSKKTGESQQLDLTFEKLKMKADGSVETDANGFALTDGAVTGGLGKLGVKNATEELVDPPDPSNPTKTWSVARAKGENAKIIYNGKINIESESNNIEVNGIKFYATGVGTTSITSQKDTDGIVDFAKKFVEEYNKLVTDLSKLVDAPKNSSYRPLTEEEKADMKEGDIKLWEQKVEDSLFSGDKDIKEVLSMMRNIIGGSVKGEYGSVDGKDLILDSIGISSGKLGDANSWKEKGKLTLDEDKLRKAITEDPEAVVETFNAFGRTLQQEFLQQMKGNKQKNTNSFYNDISSKEELRVKKEEVDKLNKYAQRMEDKYYAQFTAMEKMMSQLNSQQSALAGLANM